MHKTLGVCITLRVLNVPPGEFALISSENNSFNYFMQSLTSRGKHLVVDYLSECLKFVFCVKSSSSVNITIATKSNHILNSPFLFGYSLELCRKMEAKYVS